MRYLHSRHLLICGEVLESPPSAVQRAADHAGREHDIEGLSMQSARVDLGIHRTE